MKTSKLNDTKRARQIEVQGHRGARAIYPENSLPAFMYALQIGVDTLELDLGVSKDNALIIYHDQFLNHKLCQYKNGAKIEPDILIHSLTLEEIKNIDCGSRPNPRFPQQKRLPGTLIPTLTELLDLIKNSAHPNAKKVRLNIETKSNPDRPQNQPPPKIFAELIVRELKKYKFIDRSSIQSFDHRTLLAAAELEPKLQRVALFESHPGDYVQSALAAKAQTVSPHFKKFDLQDVEAIHRAQLKLIPWTPNSPSEWVELINMGVDGIITDDPEALLKMIGR